MPGIVPLQLVDSFLLNYHVGHALFLLFLISVLGVVPLGSRRLLSVTLLAFGFLFLVTPFSLYNDDPLYLFFGLALLVGASMLYVFAEG